MEQVRRVHQQNKIIYTVVACFLAGLLAQACVGIGFGVNLDLIMIGDIMLFIPGLVIVNGVREFFYADILTGSIAWWRRSSLQGPLPQATRYL